MSIGWIFFSLLFCLPLFAPIVRTQFPFLYLRCLIFIRGFFDVRDIFSRYLRLSTTFFWFGGWGFRSIFLYTHKLFGVRTKEDIAKTYTSLTPHIIRIKFQMESRDFLAIFFYCAFQKRITETKGKKMEANIVNKNVTEKLLSNLSFWWLCCVLHLHIGFLVHVYNFIITILNSHYRRIILA